MLRENFKLYRNSKIKKYTLILKIFVIIAILAPIIANDKPLICYYKQHLLFPAFSFKTNININNYSENEILNYNMGKDWKLINSDFILFPLCAYSPNSIDALNAPAKSPFSKQYFKDRNNNNTSMPWKYRHWFGTTQNGTDVLSNIIYGTRVALIISFFSMLIAGLLGLLLGASAGFYENNKLKIGLIQIITIVPSVFLAWFYAFTVREYKLKEAFEYGGLELACHFITSVFIFSIIIYLLIFLFGKIDKLIHTTKIINFPLDNIITKGIETINSIPSLLLIISIMSIAKPSLTLLILIIGFLSWTSIARIIRAEYLREKQLEYALSAKAMGLKDFRIIFKHILPNVKNTLMIQIIFGIASSIIAESSLSFIGIGTPVETASWGKLLNEARNDISAWWLTLTPGIMIFCVTYSCYKITELLKDKK